MKSDLLQGIILVRGSTAIQKRAHRRYKKIEVVSWDTNAKLDNSKSSTASILKRLNKIRSFS